MTRVVAVTSGKAGVGKTHLSVSLAMQCARKGLRTCLFDAGMGFANAALLLGLTPRQTVSDVVAGSCSLRDILMTFHGIDIIPCSAGSDAIADLAPASLARLAQEFSMLVSYDLVIFDISSDLASNIQSLVAAVPEVLLVVTPDPNALTDAYALVKRLQRQHHTQLRVIVNQAQSDQQAQHTYEKFREVVRVYQGVELQLLGKIPYDDKITDSIVSDTDYSLVLESPVDHALAELADRFVHAAPEIDAHLSLQTFWSQLTGIEFPAAVSPQAVADTDVVSGPVRNMPAQAVTVEFNERLMQLETGMETVLQELQEIRDMASLHGTASKHDDTERLDQTTQTRNIDLRSSSRHNIDQDNPARFIRNEQRSTPIDALQLRRVVGRMLVNATPLDAPADAPPVKISVDQLQVESGNDFSLWPGRYTRISLHCQHIHKPDSFIEEIFSTCAISGCKVRHLGSHVRYWVTSGRDGCILLDGDNNDRNCVQVYMASGGNSLLESELLKPIAVPRLRRVTNGSWDAGAAPEQILGKHPYQRLLIEDAGGDPQEVFRLLRRERSPLLCAFHKADGGSAAGHLRESSP